MIQLVHNIVFKDNALQRNSGIELMVNSDVIWKDD